MAIRVAINHRTEYRYDRPVAVSPHLVRLRPAPHARTPVLAYSLRVEPTKHFVNWQQDPFGNFVARFIFPEKTRHLAIDVNVVAELTVINPFDFFLEPHADRYPFRYAPQVAAELGPYLEVKEAGPRLLEWLARVDRSERRTVDFLVDLNRRLQQDIGYVIRMESGVQTCEETLALARGSCRDSAWLLAQILRHLGLASRFVSGYLVQLAPDVKALDGPSGPEQDFTDLHAWTEVFVPGAGWLGLDPTSGLFAGEGHIPLACAPAPASAAPVTGATDPCEVEFSFHNQVTRIHEDPRVTRPYTDAQWQAVTELGRRVDRDLEAKDVRLTMGGEPTFVSIDDMDGAEWNTRALGPHKRERAEDLIRRLRDRFAPGALLHQSQGKWYPGEPLPRWALSCFWRADREPVWKDPDLFADPRRPAGHGLAEAERFAATLARRLDVDPTHVVPGYEDVYYYLWKEGTLPANLDPFDNNLKDPLERRRIARLFERGLDQVTGYALPVGWQEGSGSPGRWVSGRWRFRRERMYLLPGDSPMGLRLPLDSLPWVAPTRRDLAPPRDPFEERAPLPARGDELAGRYREHVPADTWPQGLREQPVADAARMDDDVVRTSLCVEPRNGCLHVFLPPLTGLEHFLDLVARVEETAAELELSVAIEGYEPPHDERLLRLQVTPDPGVIEVNVHPARTWDDLVEVTTALYDEARLARLATEKFMLDGRHTGTGGGNHVTLGGQRAADSPFLRRPELLASLLTYWQHHPSLSYLFSGLFVGPTSQAPRVDEARDEVLYELEIAFQQLPRGEAPAPWTVDRVLRNLLVDVTGNTHRSEFCIDKLYSPDTPVGRRGLVEFRAFEMPPHARMSAAQMLLLRALVARFWDAPYRGKPVRWGTELHDRFLLPHYAWRDFADVVCDLERAGYPLALEWYAPFLEFRFPHYGRIHADDIELELRFAIEPWHVLGEEVTAQGTARFVDSSVERLQVKVQGMVGERHAVTCNGRRVPLRPTGTRGEYVAGVRFKAWQPPSGLQPTIPAQAPLTFDLVDTWNRRAIGGCTYHVSHPAGRNYETFPVNANEAEARRIARFWPFGHSHGSVDVPAEEPHPGHPFTLDLRYTPGC
jgi:uncharacterized protein (DUF2126 family)/transglutaminase-like putative cysteine protease